MPRTEVHVRYRRHRRTKKKEEGFLAYRSCRITNTAHPQHPHDLTVDHGAPRNRPPPWPPGPTLGALPPPLIASPRPAIAHPDREVFFSASSDSISAAFSLFHFFLSQFLSIASGGDLFYRFLFSGIRPGIVPSPNQSHGHHFPIWLPRTTIHALRTLATTARFFTTNGPSLLPLSVCWGAVCPFLFSSLGRWSHVRLSLLFLSCINLAGTDYTRRSGMDETFATSGTA
ncbi:hypothetical protein MAPG_05429 [Magnaporthiopsis poae ATCC 64411]|uniref:Uncharacterized protein n=1 Tax=Magnaporthiopsis poae (strain ATCC 64411 / 73-15) TaxID=644358 RepID=A0A0C4DZD4_MAGP6|nr:hypothetical protein MAPG_05429 [Magnaporthiopsis poae ATCC 64411]